MGPTERQLEIINYDDSLVVVAKPGSGKTYTLVKKINRILKEIPEYKGVIAISYTGKASKELEQRSLAEGQEKLGSFMGTIDSFYLSEIIFPFGRHLFGRPLKELEVIEFDNPIIFKEIGSEDISDLNLWFKSNLVFLEQRYLEGYVILESISVLALSIIERSNSCVNYLKARYNYIIIDEYQDSNQEQHEVFVALKKLGLIGIAVGDADQSIYGFAQKSPEYLLELAKSSEYRLFNLSKNYRCHPSIVNYSSAMISDDFIKLESNENRLFRRQIIGDEVQVAKWLDKVIPKIMEKYEVTDFNNVGILVRGDRTGKIIDQELRIAHKYFSNNPLEKDTSLWGIVFKNLLTLLYSEERSIYEFLKSFVDIDPKNNNTKKLSSMVLKLLEHIDSGASIVESEAIFIEIALNIYPKARNNNSIETLRNILLDESEILKFSPAKREEVQIMTIHKSKGLEFDIVFHLDLHKYVFPAQFNGTYSNYEQDLNLHYVAITRAKKACVLCTSSRRTNRHGVLGRGVPSEFLTKVYKNDPKKVNLPSRK